MATERMEELDDPMTVLSAWRRLATSALHGVRATNHAFIAPIRASAAMARTATADLGDPVDSPIPSLAYEEAAWEFERTVDDVDHIALGDRVTFTKRITDEDVLAFAQLSGDTNRLHLDEGFAAETRFGGRIVHGTLVSGMISAALARLPGLTIYLSQDLDFVAPVELGSTLTATVEVVDDLGDGRYRLRTDIDTDEGDQVIDGEAVVLIDPLEE